MSSLHEKKIFEDIRARFISGAELVFAGTLLKRAYEQYPSKTALIDGQRFITYAEFYFRSILFSNKLRSANINARDRVILLYENSLEFYIAYFAVWQLGAIIVPVNI